MNNFVVTVTYLLIGIMLKHVPKFPSESATTLNLFVIYVSLPALVLIKIPGMTFSSQAFVPVLMPWIMMGVSAVLVMLFSRLFSWSREITGCLLLMIPLGNTSFLGIPMIKAFFGDSGIPYAVLYDQLGSFVGLATYGTFIIAVYGRENTEEPSIRDIAVKIVTFPPFVALVAAIMLKSFEYPQTCLTILNALSSTLVPVVMIAVGFQFSLTLSPAIFPPLAMGLAIKLVIAPVIALGICMSAGLDNEASRVAVMEAGMPPMVSAGALAIIAGLAPDLAAALAGVGIIFCFVTLPLLYKAMSLLC